MIRTRFAPSPTGSLHIGSVRTALYCYLYAKHCNGTFVLRIEDTDRERSTDESVQTILDGMHWLNLNYDEGPYYQTQRFDRYREVAEQLLAQGHAYRCYCSKERLEQLRATQLEQKEKPRYDGRCRQQSPLPPDATANAPHVIRFKNPLVGSVLVDDLLHGPIQFENTELDDLIILRSDNTPTYNFTVVVDDWDMQISHVIRGNDHLNNTPRQINILQALGAHIPSYVHLPMILGEDGKKMSKRQGAISVMDFRQAGYLPQALLNYLVRLGWSRGDQEIMSVAEMITHFDLKNLNKSAAIFDMQKLLWLNQHYLKTLPAANIIPELTWHMQQLNIDIHDGPPLEQLIAAQAERSKTVKEMAERSHYFYHDIEHYAQNDLQKHFSREIIPAFEFLTKELTQLDDWTPSKLHHLIHEVAQAHGFNNMGKIAQPLRIAVTGGTTSPPIEITLELLGKEKVLHRIQQVMECVMKQHADNKGI